MLDNLRLSMKNFCNGCFCCSKDLGVKTSRPIQPVESEVEITVTQVYHRVHKTSNPETPRNEPVAPISPRVSEFPRLTNE